MLPLFRHSLIIFHSIPSRSSRIKTVKGALVRNKQKSNKTLIATKHIVGTGIVLLLAGD